MTMLAAFLHTIDPYAIELWEGGPIRWYGLSYVVGFFIGYLLIRRVTKVGISPLPPARAADLVVALALGIFIGGRLGYVFFYRPSLLWTFFGHLPFWGVLAINEGGMASHGGMIGGFIACAYFARRYHQSPLFLLDLLGFAAPLGLFFGRVANFINGELFGRPCSADYVFAVKFPQEMHEWTFDQWTLVEQASNLPAQWMFNPDLLIAKIQQGNAQVIEAVQPFLKPRHPSQIYEAILEGLVLFAVLLWTWRKPRKPGTISAVFLIVYGLVRIMGEQFREPDAHIANLEAAQWGITRGQLLSSAMILVGAVLLLWVRKRHVERLGSWRRSAKSNEAKPRTQG
jgi:phosphatidylglycerol:prolipoprotein diacylglycerol transferase